MPGPKDFVLAIVLGLLLQAGGLAIHGEGHTFEGERQIIVPLWALYGSTCLLGFAVWRSVRTRPAVMRAVCVLWTVVGGYLIAALIRILASGYGVGIWLVYDAALSSLHWWAALVQWGLVVVMLLREQATKPVSLAQAVWVITGGQVVALLTGYAAWARYGLNNIYWLLAVALILGASWSIVQGWRKGRVK